MMEEKREKGETESNGSIEAESGHSCKGMETTVTKTNLDRYSSLLARVKAREVRSKEEEKLQEERNYRFSLIPLVALIDLIHSFFVSHSRKKLIRASTIATTFSSSTSLTMTRPSTKVEKLNNGQMTRKNSMYTN